MTRIVLPLVLVALLDRRGDARATALRTQATRYVEGESLMEVDKAERGWGDVSMRAQALPKKCGEIECCLAHTPRAVQRSALGLFAGVELTRVYAACFGVALGWFAVPRTWQT